MNREMDERKIKDEERAEEIVNRSPSHTKNPTACIDTRRSYDACGICGSENTIFQGVNFCGTCGIEVEFINTFEYWSSRETESICNCPDIEKIYKSNYVYKTSPRDFISVGKCCDCGAVYSKGFCNNCEKSEAWKHWDGRVYCRKCGYRIDKPNKKTKFMSSRKKKRLEAKNRPHPNKILT